MKNTFFFIIVSLSFVVVVRANWLADERLRIAFWTAAAGKNNNCSELAEVVHHNHVTDEKTLTNLVGDAGDYNTCVENLSTLVGDAPDDSTINKFKATLDLMKLVET